MLDDQGSTHEGIQAELKRFAAAGRTPQFHHCTCFHQLVKGRSAVKLQALLRGRQCPGEERSWGSLSSVYAAFTSAAGK